jgi:hypothetical protein
MPEFSFFQCDNCHRPITAADAHSTGLPRLNDAAVRRLIEGGGIPASVARQALEQHLDALDAAVLHGSRQDYGAAAAALHRSLQSAAAGAGGRSGQ